MKKIALSSVVAALVALPALGIEVYNNEEKDASVNIYGTLKGYVGGGGNLAQVGNSNATNENNTGNFLIGFQNNSNFGIDTKYGKLFTKIEFGLHETGFLSAGNGPGLRKVYGSYDFGSAGKLTFGKLDTPTVEGGFQSDFNNNDAGGNGFGSITTGSRKLQVQYSHSGVTVAIIADEAREGPATATNYAQSYAANARLDTFPRIAIGYESKIGEKGKFKVAATYKWLSNSGYSTTAHNVQAGHLLVGAKIPLSDNYLSVFFNYGINGHTYLEQQTAVSVGNYGYSQINDAAGLWAQRAGLHFEFGGKVSDLLAFAAGFGYQATFNGDNQRGNARSSQQAIHGYKFFVNVPLNVAKGFQIVPQLAFYDTVTNVKGNADDLHQAALLGLVRLQYSF